MKQATLLAQPFPKGYIKTKPGKGNASYVSHEDYTQRLLSIVGPFDFKVVTPLRNHETGKVEGCIAELTVSLDGERVSVQEVGDCEFPDNWKTDGARMKDSISDAFKRCCMRLGLGLHLWCDHYVLFDNLSKKESGDNSGN